MLLFLLLLTLAFERITCITVEDRNRAGRLFETPMVAPQSL